MIIGIGTDIIEITRVKEACERYSFREKCFTAKELEQAVNRINSLAGDFAVKEAVSKALGTGFSGIGLKDIECLRDENGRPYVRLSGRALEVFNEAGGQRILVTISHSRDNAVAFAVIEN